MPSSQKKKHEDGKQAYFAHNYHYRQGTATWLPLQKRVTNTCWQRRKKWTTAHRVEDILSNASDLYGRCAEEDCEWAEYGHVQSVFEETGSLLCQPQGNSLSDLLGSLSVFLRQASGVRILGPGRLPLIGLIYRLQLTKQPCSAPESQYWGFTRSQLGYIFSRLISTLKSLN